jgi:hypothetical protein
MTQQKINSNEIPEQNAVVDLTDDHRVQVLLAQMNERYSAWHQMRSRSMEFTLWILGLSVAASWNLIQEPCHLLPQRIAATVFVIALGGAAAYFLLSLARGVRTNREALINVETALGAHGQGIFLRHKSVLPPEYKDSKPRASAHFFTLYALLLTTAVYLLAAIWLPCTPSPEPDRNKPATECSIRSAGQPSRPEAQNTTTNTKGNPHD